MTVERKKLGKEGEAYALKYLKKHGYKIIEKNYRSQYGEIDIIGKDRNILVFVEVKTRTNWDPLEAVNKHKQKQLTRVALSYLAEKGLENSECRFDVVGINTGTGKMEITLIKDAFEAEGE